MKSDRPSAFFIADHPALDFLNTVATPKDVPIDWLENGQDLIDWMEQANLISPDVTTRFRAKAKSRELDSVAERARAFRNWLRQFVARRMGRALCVASAKELKTLNDLLACDTSYPLVDVAERERSPQLRRIRRWAGPEELLTILAESAADLICSIDFRLIRACEGSPCTLLFLDRTKAHGRRWCSMAVCGNRAKVAAHRGRKARG